MGGACCLTEGVGGCAWCDGENPGTSGRGRLVKRDPAGGFGAGSGMEEWGNK